MKQINHNEFLLKNLKSAVEECEKFNERGMQPITKALQDAYDTLFTLDYLGLSYNVGTERWEFKAEIDYNYNMTSDFVLKTIYAECRICGKVFSRDLFIKNNEPQPRICPNCNAGWIAEENAKMGIFKGGKK